MATNEAEVIKEIDDVTVEAAVKKEVKPAAKTTPKKAVPAKAIAANAARKAAKPKTPTEKLDVKKAQDEKNKANTQRIAKTQKRNAARRNRRQQTTVELTNTRTRASLKVEDQVSMLADSMPTIEEVFEYQTSFMHKFLADRGHVVMQVSERLASAMRALSIDARTYNQLSEWVSDSINTARDELKVVVEQRKLLEQTISDIDGVTIKSPKKYVVKFTFTTPVGRQVVALMRNIDQELAHAQRLYFAGALNDLELANANRQGLKIINDFTDRVFQVTASGKRDGGRFSSGFFHDSMVAERLLNEEEAAGQITSDDKPDSQDESIQGAD